MFDIGERIRYHHNEHLYSEGKIVGIYMILDEEAYILEVDKRVSYDIPVMVLETEKLQYPPTDGSVKLELLID